MKKNLTLEESKRRFQQILEYTNYAAPMQEADDDKQQPNDAPADPNMQGGGMPADPGMGGAPMDGAQGGDMMGGAPADPGMGGMDNGAMPPMDGAQGGMPADPGMGGAPMDNGQGGAPQTPEGFNPQDDMGGDGDITPGDFEGGVNTDDEVVDVSELTDAQEETDEKLEQYGEKFEKVFQVLGQWEELLKSNNEKIEDLKAEFEKRNPTQVEKLSMQTAKSGPFNVKPEDYWNEKEATSNYSTEPDNNGVGQGQYVITKDDVDGTTDWKSISDSLNDDVLYRPTLKNTMGNW